MRRDERLAPGIDRAGAEDVTWALISWELCLMLVRDRGWTAERYEARLARLLAAALLPACDGPLRRRRRPQPGPRRQGVAGRAGR